MDSSASIVNSSFAFNTVGNYRGPIQVLELGENNDLPGTRVYAYVGGAIIANRSDIIIVGSGFKGNSAEVGGAIFATVCSNITIINSNFVKNMVDNYLSDAMVPFGGVLYSESGIIPSNVAEANIVLFRNEFCNNSATLGGVISTFKCSVSVNSSKFHDNMAQMAGGVLAVYERSEVNMHNCEFWNNHALSKGGGVILTAGFIVVNISTSHFNSNQAGEGGGVMFINAYSTVNISTSRFNSNVAKLGGGALFLQTNSTVSIHQGDFWNNHVLSYGGVILADSSVVNITMSHFNSNIADSGGVMFIVKHSTVRIYQGEFWSNSARFGGAIQLGNANVTIIKSHFHNNTGNTQGGVMDSSKQCSVIFHECEFSNNVAVLNGGGTISMAYTKNFTISGCHFINNRVFNSIYSVGGALSVLITTLILYSNSFRDNEANAGGAIHVYQSSVIFSSNKQHCNTWWSNICH